MDNLNRYELSTILDGLQLVRDEMRKELFDAGEVQNLLDDPEYSNLVLLQEKILTLRSNIAY
jgi:hypothetical protein